MTQGGTWNSILANGHALANWATESFSNSVAKFEYLKGGFHEIFFLFFYLK